MLLSEAKQILKKAGFLMESNTKDLVKTFWDKRKAGDTLTKEEAEELLNAPDFDTAVNPKYQNFIKSTCNKILGIAKPEKPKEEKPKAEPIQGPNEDVIKLSEELKDCFKYSNYEKVDLDGWIDYYVSGMNSFKKQLEKYKDLFPKLTDKAINNLYLSRNDINNILENLKLDVKMFKEIIENNGQAREHGSDYVKIATVPEMKKLLSYVENVYKKLSESKENIIEQYETINGNIIKSLVKKFWAAKKGGPKLTKEEVELFYKLNSFSAGLSRVFEKVCGKYCDYIRKNFDKYSEVYEPPKEDDDPWAGVETMSDAQLKRWGHWH